MDTARIRPHMDVVGSDGQHVGTVDGLEGDRIKLTRHDPDASGAHHYVPLDLVADVDDGQVELNCSADQARAALGSGPPSQPGGSTGLSSAQL
jgi:hypothetical protein